MEKQNDLVQSDISYLKLDDSIKRNKLNTMQDIINENKTAIENHEVTVCSFFFILISYFLFLISFAIQMLIFFCYYDR